MQIIAETERLVIREILPKVVVILYVKLIEIIMQTRPSALKRLLFHKEKRLRSAMLWYTKIGRRVWFWELAQFFFVTRLTTEKIKLKDFWK